MLFVRSNSNNPFFNLATEEYLLKNSAEEIFMLWISQPAVIIGKHQNALAEINYRYVLENNIVVARRLSGGGTVVHDFKNLNFAFITNGELGKLIDFQKILSPIIAYLNTIGIKAEILNKNEIRTDKKKISGNSGHVYKNRVLHHGTLLFDSDLQQLSMAIKTHPGHYFDKAVQSNRASVTNIASHLKTKIDFEKFIEDFVEYIQSNSYGLTEYSIAEPDKVSIQKLVDEKYCTIDWIYGYSPKYLFKNDFLFDGISWKVELTVEKGKIQGALLYKDTNRLVEIEKLLIGEFHLYMPMQKVLKDFHPLISDVNLEELTLNFF